MMRFWFLQTCGGSCCVICFASLLLPSVLRWPRPSEEIAGRFVRVKQRPPAGGRGVLAGSGHQRRSCSQGRLALHRGMSVSATHWLFLSVEFFFDVAVSAIHALMDLELMHVMSPLLLLSQPAKGGSAKTTVENLRICRNFTTLSLVVFHFFSLPLCSVLPFHVQSTYELSLP